MTISLSDFQLTRAWIEINLDAIHTNCSSLCTGLSPDVSLMAVLKADAYGHGLLPVAHAALAGGARWLGVATVGEGAALRNDSIETPIALLCPATPMDARDVVRYGLTPMVGDFEYAAALADASFPKGVEVHIEIDTGMGRSGILPDDAVSLWQGCVAGGLRVSGIATHLADADGNDRELTQLQWRRFATAQELLYAAGARFEWIHAANSAALARYGSNGCNLVRPGMLIYGIGPEDWQYEENADEKTHQSATENGVLQTIDPIALRPALSLKARIATVRSLPAGHTISYGATHVLARDSRVATVLIGYVWTRPLLMSPTFRMWRQGTSLHAWAATAQQ